MNTPRILITGATGKTGTPAIKSRFGKARKTNVLDKRPRFTEVGSIEQIGEAVPEQ